MKILDCTLTIDADLATYPGDPPAHVETAFSLGNGDPFELRRMHLSTHTGTHVDAPRHIFLQGKTLDDFPLDVWLGPASVIEIADRERVSREELQSIGLGKNPRILLKTANSQLWAAGVKDYAKDHVHLTSDAAEYLVELGVRLVGIDYLSIDKFGDSLLPAHNVLLGNDILILEGLNLSEVHQGEYQLVCLPLKLKEAEAAPARVFLLQE